MSKIQDIQSISENIQALILFQDDNNALSIENMIKEYSLVFEGELNNLVGANGFKSVTEFLKASPSFKVFEAIDGKMMVNLSRLQNTDNLKKGSSKDVTSEKEIFTPLAPTKKQRKSKQTAIKPTPAIEIMDTDAPETVEIIEIMDTSDPDCGEKAKSHIKENKLPKTNEVQQAEKPGEPTFVVKIYDNIVLKEQERKKEELKQKDLRHLINAKRFMDKKEWKNDMFEKLYPEEMLKQAKIIAEKQRLMTIRKTIMDH